MLNHREGQHKRDNGQALLKEAVRGGVEGIGRKSGPFAGAEGGGTQNAKASHTGRLDGTLVGKRASVHSGKKKGGGEILDGKTGA